MCIFVTQPFDGFLLDLGNSHAKARAEFSRISRYKVEPPSAVTIHRWPFIDETRKSVIGDGAGSVLKLCFEDREVGGRA